MTTTINKTISLRSFKGKKLVSYLRNGDYAHAGECESIIKVMEKFPKDPARTILDVGCGLGGTTAFIKENGWGNAVGVDIEAESIHYARENYPSVEFHVSDVIDINTYFKHRKFNLFCIFNSFYSFNDQQKALEAMHAVGKKNSVLTIFDYSDPLKDAITPLFKESDESTPPFKPIKIADINSLLSSSGWKLLKFFDISDDYIKWYGSLLAKLESNKAIIINHYGQNAYYKARQTYSSIYNAVLQKVLGGVVLYALKRD